MTVSTSDSPDDAAAAVLAALLGDGSPGESPRDATDVADGWTSETDSTTQHPIKEIY